MATLRKALNTFNEVQVAPTIKDDAAGFIFQNLGVALRSSQKVATKTLSLNLDLEDNTEVTSFRQDIRGFASLDAGITATLFIQSNGKSHQFNFTKESCSEQIKESVAGEIQASHSYLTTLVLVLENSTSDKKLEGSFTIDSLDIELTNSGES